MKILVAVDQNPYSSRAVGEVAQLAANTWANVSLLGIQSKNTVLIKKKGLKSADGPLPDALFSLRSQFFSHFDRKECPYVLAESGQELVEIRKGLYEVPVVSKRGKKEFGIRLRIGSPGKEILNEAGEEQSDLIVLGCDDSNGCGWEGDAGVARKVAYDASCSVLIVKKKKNIKRIMCCLDHDHVSQPSLEMINQMVTLHGAQLTLIGLTENFGLKMEVEKKMDKILRYYHARRIDPWIELLEIASLDSFIAQESRWGLMALWMGKQSILERALPRSKFNKLIKGGEASVLILR